MSKMQRITISLFHWSELINLGILFLFYDVIDHTFLYIYAAVLFAAGTIKIIARVKQTPFLIEIEEYLHDCSVITFVVFLSEFSLIFLTYTGVSVKLPFIITLAGIALAAILLVCSKKIKISFIKPVLIVTAIAALCTLILHKFSISTELIKLSFILSLIILFDHRDSYLGGLILLLISCVLLFLNHEAGSSFILLLSYDIFCLTSDSKKVRRVALITTAVVVTVWVLIFFTPLYDLIDGLIDTVFSCKPSICTSLHNMMNRLFFRYKSTDQLPLLHSLINGQSTITKLTCIFSPAPFTEIVKFETGESTSSADYLFSLILFFLGPIAGIILSSLSMLFYSNSIRKNYESEYRIIPITLLSQTLIHICGNLMLLPFTGIPYPFLSHGASSLLISFLLVFLLTYHEMRGEC